MSLPLRMQNLLEPIHDASGVELPPRFAEALRCVRNGIVRCEKMGIPHQTVLAALMTEAMPRLVRACGSSAAKIVLERLANEVSNADDNPTSIQ